MGENQITYSRRSVLKKGAIATGAIVLGGTAVSGTAAAGIGDGRVLDYHLDNINYDRERGEIVSNFVHDASPADNDGVWKGDAQDPVVKDGAVGNAFEFKGDGDHVYVGDIEEADGTNTLTLAAWINPTATGQGDFFTKNTSGERSNSSWVFRYDGEGNQTVSAHFNDEEENWTAIRSDASVQTNVFTHVAVTIDGETRTLYLDGSLEKSDDYAARLDDEDAPVVLGAANNAGGGVTNEFVGYLDEVRVYDRALSASEITDLYEMKD